MKKKGGIVMKKFDVKKISEINWLPILLAAASGIAAFVGSLKDSEREKQIDEQEERLARLEELLK